MLVALTDPACGERIAVGSANRYLQALVKAIVAVRTDPAHAGRCWNRRSRRRR